MKLITNRTLHKIDKHYNGTFLCKFDYEKFEKSINKMLKQREKEIFGHYLEGEQQ